MNSLIGEVRFGHTFGQNDVATEDAELRPVFAAHPPDRDMVARCACDTGFDPDTGLKTSSIHERRFQSDVARPTCEWLYRPLSAT